MIQNVLDDKHPLVCPVESGFKLEACEGSPKVAVLLPAYNEAETIKEVVMNYFDEIITKLPSKLIVAEDGSTDETPEILFYLSKAIPISVYSERTRKGYAKGVADALKRCKEEWVFFSDSDGQYFPSDFWRLWENRLGYDMVVGHKVHRYEGLHRIILSRGFHALANFLFGLNLHDGDCGFRLIRKNVIRSVVDRTQILKYSFWAEFTIRASLGGFKVREVPVSHANRENGGTRIYTPSKIPIIVLKQLKGLLRLYRDTKNGH